MFLLGLAIAPWFSAPPKELFLRASCEMNLRRMVAQVLPFGRPLALATAMHEADHHDRPVGKYQIASDRHNPLL
jgi:hypothetical protein